ncbi:MAG: hypothetical protein AB1792_11400 [Candidatus Zixiibacteriota bacterium]
MNCSELKRRLSDPIGFHSPDAAAHIRACPECRRVWEAERLLRDGLAAARTDGDAVHAMGIASAWVKAVVEPERRHPMKSFVKNPLASARRRWSVSLAAAAVVLAFLVLVPFSYEHTVGTRLLMTSADPEMAQVDLNALTERLAASGLGAVNVAWSNEAGGRALAYYVHGSSSDAMAAFAATRDLIPAEVGNVMIAPWRVRESGSLLAQIGSRVVEISVSGEGKTEDEMAAEVRQQLEAQGIQAANVTVRKSQSDSCTTVQIGLSGDAGEGSVEAQLKCVVNGAEPGMGADGTIAAKVVLPDSTLTDDEKIAEIKRQLAAQGVQDATVTIENGMIKVECNSKIVK